MHILSNSAYQEYLTLKQHYGADAYRKSIDSITALEDDIDLPIKASVAMLALFGCKPYFSCCGFDYAGQPFHKFHQYGRAYILMQDTPLAIDFAKSVPKGIGWEYTTARNIIDLHADFSSGPIAQWQADPLCPHYHEVGVTRIYELEKYLKRLSQYFASTATVQDSNAIQKRVFRFWQYPAKREWIVRKADYV